MGNQQSKNIIYALSIDNKDKKDNESHIYRAPESLELDLNNYPLEFKTLHDAYRSTFNENPDAECMGYRQRNPDGSLQNCYTWLSKAEIKNAAEEIGSGLVSLGLYNQNNEWDGRSMKMAAIYSKNTVEYYALDIGMVMYGINSVPLYDTLGEESTPFILNQTKVNTCFLSANHVEKLITEQKTKKPFLYLRNLVVMDPENYNTEIGRKHPNVFKIYTLDDVRNEGKKKIHEWAPITGETVYMISYTSGTTGIPKGAVITHKNLMSIYEGVDNRMKVTHNDTHISFLPMAHMFERAVYNLFLLKGCRIGLYNGDILKLKEDIAILKPTIFVSVPRLLNKFHDGIKAKLSQETGLKASLINHAISAKLENLKSKGQYTHAIYDRIVFKKIREVLGGNVRLMLTGSAPISVEVLDFLKIAFSCPILEGYGQTEGTAAEFINLTEDPISGHVGGPMPQNEFKLVDVQEMGYTNKDKDEHGRARPRGEIWVRGPNVIPGYFLNSEDYKLSFHNEGWLMSGDIGQINPGTNSLQLIDRKKNIFKLSQGEYIAPEKLESLYKLAHPAITDMFVYGDSLKSCLVAVIGLDQASLPILEKSLGIEISRENINQNEELKAKLIGLFNEVAAQKSFTKLEQLKRIHIELTPFSELDLLTATFKKRRAEFKRYYQSIFDEMYRSLD